MHHSRPCLHSAWHEKLCSSFVLELHQPHNHSRNTKVQHWVSNWALWLWVQSLVFILSLQKQVNNHYKSEKAYMYWAGCSTTLRFWRNLWWISYRTLHGQENPRFLWHLMVVGISQLHRFLLCKLQCILQKILMVVVFNIKSKYFLIISIGTNTILNSIQQLIWFKWEVVKLFICIKYVM